MSCYYVAWIYINDSHIKMSVFDISVQSPAALCFAYELCMRRPIGFCGLQSLLFCAICRFCAPKALYYDAFSMRQFLSHLSGDLYQSPSFSCLFFASKLHSASFQSTKLVKGDSCFTL